MKNLSGPVLALAFLGALGVLFGTYAAYWYVGHQMAWWTFALLGVSATVFWELVKTFIKEVRK